MKKKILASLLALVLLLGMLPLTALAATPEGVTVTPSGTWSEVDGVKVYTATGNLSLAQSGTDGVTGNNEYKFGYYPAIQVTPGDADYVILSRGQNEKAFDETTLNGLLKNATSCPYSVGTDSLENWFQVYATTGDGEHTWTDDNAIYWPNSANAPVTNIVLAKASTVEETTTYTYTKYKFDFSACTIEMPFTTVAAATDTVLGKTITDVQENISVTTSTNLKEKTIKVTGKCKWVDSWPDAGFSAETGNYVALTFTPNANVQKIQVKMSTGDVWKELDKADNTLVWQFNEGHTNTTVPMKVTFGDNSGHTGATVSYTLDLSEVAAATEPVPTVVAAPLADNADGADPEADLGSVEVNLTKAEAAKTYNVTVTGSDIVAHENSQHIVGYWVGFGMEIDGSSGTGYTYQCKKGDGDFEDVAGAPGRVISSGTGADTKYYNTIYFDKAGTYTVVQKKGDNIVATYNVTVEINKKALEVVPANLTTVANKPAPGFGHVGTYTAAFNADKTAINVTAVDLEKTVNSDSKNAYWVGIGLTQQAGATYATGWGTAPETISSYGAADNSQVVGDVTYDTVYWGTASENDATFWTQDTSKIGWVSVKEADGEVRTYTVNFDVKVRDENALLGSEMTLTKMGAVGSDGRFNYLLRADRYAKVKEGDIIIAPENGDTIVKYKWEVAEGNQNPTGGLGFEWSLRDLDEEDGYSVTGAPATELEAKNSTVVPAGTYKVTVVATPFGDDGAVAKTYYYTITITEDMRKDVMVERAVTTTVADGKTATVTCTAEGSPTELYGGETVTVNVTDIQYGYELDKIEVNGAAITGTTFTMPADSDAAVTVTLKKAPLPGATLQYTAVADTTIVSDCAPDTMWVTFERALPRNTHLWFVIEGGGKTYGIAADSATDADTTTKFAWSFQNKGQFEKWAKEADGTTDVALGSTPGATYTVKGYVLDAAGTSGTDVSGKEAFATWTVKVPEAKVEAPGKTVVDASELPEDMSEPDMTAAKAAAASVAVDAASKTVLTTAANNAVKDVLVAGSAEEIAEAKAEALATVGGITGITDETETKIVYVPALKVTPKDYTADPETGAKTLEVDIIAVLNAVVTAESTDVDDIKIKVNADDETAGTNAAIVGESKELTIDKPIDLSITLPDDFVTPDQDGTIYVLHKGHYHPGTYTAADKKLSFTSTDGLSPFVISTSASPAAQIGADGASAVYYDTLQEAVNAVKNGETIKLLANVAADARISVTGSTRTFYIDTNGNNFSKDNITGATVTGDASPYAVAYTAPSTGGGGGGGGGGGSSANVIVSSASGGKVSVSDRNAKKGDTVTITTTPNTGKKVDTVTVTDAKGNKIAVTDAGNGKYTFVMPDGKVTVKVTFTDDPAAGKTVFSDVPAGAYYADAVAWAVEMGITNGTGANTFSPEAPCTRAQIVTFLWRAAGSPKASGRNPFTDVKETDYFYDAVLWAVEMGITNGTGADTFSPANTCTRGQTVTFLYRYAGQPAAAGSNPFVDVAAGEYYTSAVLWAVEKGITNGTGADTFSPANTCTRGQIVTFLYRDLAE